MATEEEVEHFLQLMYEVHPQHSFKEVDKTSEGLGAVLHFLSRTEGSVTSGQIAQAMQVSTARMAVLLKKLEGKGLIIREPGVNDARTTVVHLSADGQEKVETMRKEIHAFVHQLIDAIGMERLEEFAAVSKEIIVVAKRYWSVKDMEKAQDHKKF